MPHASVRRVSIVKYNAWLWHHPRDKYCALAHLVCAFRRGRTPRSRFSLAHKTVGKYCFVSRAFGMLRFDRSNGVYGAQSPKCHRCLACLLRCARELALFGAYAGIAFFGARPRLDTGRHSHEGNAAHGCTFRTDPCMLSMILSFAGVTKSVRRSPGQDCYP